MSLVRRSPAVVVSRVNGIATAAGAQLVATCDLAVATPSSTFATPGSFLVIFVIFILIILHGFQHKIIQYKDSK